MPRPWEKREAALMGEKGKAEGLEPLDEKQFPLNTLKSARVQQVGTQHPGEWVSPAVLLCG